MFFVIPHEETNQNITDQLSLLVDHDERMRTNKSPNNWDTPRWTKSHVNYKNYILVHTWIGGTGERLRATHMVSQQPLVWQMTPGYWPSIISRHESPAGHTLLKSVMSFELLFHYNENKWFIINENTKTNNSRLNVIHIVTFIVKKITYFTACPKYRVASCIPKGRRAGRPLNGVW